MKSVAVVGASGAVGDVLIRLLEEREFPVGAIKFLASERSAGKSVTFRGESFPIEPLRPGAFLGVDIVLSSTPASISKQYSPIAAEAGAVVVDNSSAWRMDPERAAGGPRGQPARRRRAPRDHRQPELLDDPDGRRPEALARRLPRPAGGGEHLPVGLGGGRRACANSRPRPRRTSAAPPARAWKFAHPIAFNCIPQIDDFLPSGYTKEEMKMVHETRKIMGDDSIDVCPTCVRVPVLYSHSESILVETERPITPEAARASGRRPRGWS